MAVQATGRTQELMAKRDAYVARGVSLAPIVASRAHGARLIDADGREFIDFAGGIGVLNLGHTPDAVVAAIKEQAEALLHCVLPGGRLRAVPGGVPAAGRARPGRFRQEGGADQLRRRGRRERRQDRPLPHRARRGDHVRPGLPRPHAADDDPDVEAGLQEGDGPVRPRGLPGAGAVPVPRHLHRGRAGRAGLHVQGDGRPPGGGLRDPRAGAGRGRVHGDAARVHPGAQGALRASTASSTSTTRCRPAWAAPARCGGSSTRAWCPT